MHANAEIMDEHSRKNFRMKKNALIPFILMITMLGALFSVGTPSEPNKVAARADGDTLNWSGNWACHPLGWWGLPLCNSPRPVNPPVGVVCAKPQLTVAVLIDRSDSVIRDTGGATPALFKKSVELLLDDLYARFDPNDGELNFLVYAFGTKSVIQNAKDSSGNYITDASTPDALEAMKDAINRIHFRNGENYSDKNDLVNGFESNTQSPYDLARAYNAGSEAAGGSYGLTNWQSPLVDVLRAQSGTYNDPIPGKKIDLTVMFTDGFPDKSNGKDWNWTPGSFHGNDREGYSWDEFKAPLSVAQEYESRYSGTDDLYRPELTHSIRGNTAAVVDVLRSGNGAGRSSFGGNFFAPRPKVSVRGIIIRPNASNAVRTDANWWGSSVFGDNNYYFAEDFDDALKSRITGMAQAIMEETGCQNLITPIRPGITVSVNKDIVQPLEGSSGELVEVTVTNTGQGDLENVKVCFTLVKNSNCAAIWSIDKLLPGVANEKKFNWTIAVPLGGEGGEKSFFVFGRSNAPDEALVDWFAAGNGRDLDNSDPIIVDPGRVSLPA